MTEQEAIGVMMTEKHCVERNIKHECDRDCVKCDLLMKDNDVLNGYDMAIKSLEEVQKYRAIGTVEECRAAVEKQKEMIAYCDENDCADCLFYNATKKYNKCMNDFIAEEIEKGGVVNE